MIFAFDTFELDKGSWIKGSPYRQKLGDLSHEGYYKKRFGKEIAEGRVIIKRGLSSSVLSEFSDQSFDLIYIDAAHDYENVKTDLDIATKKIKSDGVIVLNDYTVLDPLLLQPYGIVQAVNELCEGGAWEIVYLALHRYMFCDVALRRVAS